MQTTRIGRLKQSGLLSRCRFLQGAYWRIGIAQQLRQFLHLPQWFGGDSDMTGVKKGRNG